jgi:hypothetical protein
MNKISKIAAIALLSTLSAVTVQAAGAVTPSVLTFSTTSGNYNQLDDVNLTGPLSNKLENNVSIDGAKIGNNAYLVFKPKVNLTSGSKFHLLATNSAFLTADEVSLCDGNTSIGKMVSQGDIGTGTMNKMRFRINDADDTFSNAHFGKDGQFTFSAANTCDGQPPLQLTGTGLACQPISVAIVEPVDDSGLPFNDYTTPAAAYGQTKRLVSIACDVPVCNIDVNAGSKLFTTTAAPGGINNSPTVSSGSLTANTYCPECAEAAIASCTTTISVRNMSKDFNVTSATFTPVFTDNKNAGMKLDGNGSVTNIGAKIVKVLTTGTSIGATSEQKISITYNPTKSSVIAAGLVTGKITLKSGASTLNTTRTEDTLAKFQAAGTTKFIVPYMNSSYKTFVKITTMSDKGAKLSAVITDQNGKTADVTLADIGANGTVYLFSTKGPLFDAAKAAGLASAWTVQFDTTAAASVVSYMTTANGERRVEAY